MQLQLRRPARSEHVVGIAEIRPQPGFQIDGGVGLAQFHAVERDVGVFPVGNHLQLQLVRPLLNRKYEIQEVLVLLFRRREVDILNPPIRQHDPDAVPALSDVPFFGKAQQKPAVARLMFLPDQTERGDDLLLRHECGIVPVGDRVDHLRTRFRSPDPVLKTESLLVRIGPQIRRPAVFPRGVVDLKILLYASPDCRAERIAERENLTPEEACSATIEREACEAARYMEYYEIDIADPSPYDLVINSETFNQEEVVAIAESVMAIISAKKN